MRHRDQRRGDGGTAAAAPANPAASPTLGGALTPLPARDAPDPVDATLNLRATVELAPVGLAQLGPDGRFLLVNDQLCAILGFPRDALLGRPFAEITFPDDLPRCHALTADLAAGRIERYAHEKRFLRPDGAHTSVRVTVSAVRAGDGTPTFFVAAAEDITAERAESAARREVEERLRVALHASATGIFRWDLRRDTLEWDENLDRLFGLTPAESPRTVDAFLALVHADDRARVAEACRRCAELGADFDEELRRDWPDGSTHWLCGKGRCFADEDGVLRYLTGAASDVTERRRAEDALRSEEARFHTLADAIPQLAWMTDATGGIHWYNRRWYDYTGTTLEEMRGWGWQQVHHPDHVGRVVERIRHSFDTGEPWEDTFPLRGADGRYRWFLSRALPMRAATGAVVGWFGTNTDITERREAEEAVRTSEAKLRRISDSGIVGVFYWTAAGAITEANAEFCRTLGLSPEDVRSGRVNWRSLTPPEWAGVDAVKEAELATHGFTTNWEKELIARDGRRVPVLIGAARLEGAADRGIAVCLDISGRREAEAERERLLAAERTARMQAERAIGLRDEVLAVVAHDLRNPVHTIVMSVATMLELPLDEAQRQRQFGVIQRAAKGMDRLIRDLLDATRIESGTFAIRQARVHVRALLDETLELFEADARARGISLGCDADADVPPILGDRDRLVQALSNLLGNALKFTPPGGEIRVVARCTSDPDDGWVAVSVENSGAGIPAEHLPHVFDRFWQADRRTRAGAGLGLAIVKGIVEAHGGRAQADSTPGQRTTFTFTLPSAPRVREGRRPPIGT
jgi:PAS domain S-box-containing protein